MARPRKILYFISTSHFYCGILTDLSGRVVKAAPIVGYMKGWKIKKVYKYCDKRKFMIEQVIYKLE